MQLSNASSKIEGMVIGARSLLIASFAVLIATCVVGGIGYAYDVTYPHVPHWFSRGMHACFFISLLLTVISVCAAFYKKTRRTFLASAALAFGTACLIAWANTTG